jgi:hypothetical protein
MLLSITGQLERAAGTRRALPEPVIT